MTATLASDKLSGDRAFDRDLAEHIPSRGERRRLRQRRKDARMWSKRDARIMRAFQRVHATALCAKMNPGTFPDTVRRIRSWKEASRIANPGGDLWLRARVKLKQFGQKRQRTESGQLQANAARMLSLLEGKQYKVADDKSDKIRFIRPGLAKKIMAGGQGRMSDEVEKIDLNDGGKA